MRAVDSDQQLQALADRRRSRRLPELPVEPDAAYLLGWDHGSGAGFGAGISFMWEHLHDFLARPEVQDQITRGNWPGVVDRFAGIYREQRIAVQDAITSPMSVSDDWRRVCLKAFENLGDDTAVTIAQVDRVLTIGARRVAVLDTSTEADAAEYRRVVGQTVEVVVDVAARDVDAILTWCAKDAAELLAGVGQP